jgi:hypothetical protein
MLEPKQSAGSVNGRRRRREIESGREGRDLRFLALVETENR